MTAVPPSPLQGRPGSHNPFVQGAQASNALSHPKAAGQDPRIKEAAQQFEAVFIRQMLSSLEKTTSAPAGTQASGGPIYGSMVVNTVADAIANAGGLGLADLLTKSLQSAEQGAPRPSPRSVETPPRSSGAAFVRQSSAPEADVRLGHPSHQVTNQ
jgi:flagellar protein FlgJ